MTSPLLRLPRKPTVDVEPRGDTMTTSDGRTWQGFRPVDDDDDRYFERATAPDGTETWYVLD